MEYDTMRKCGTIGIPLFLIFGILGYFVYGGLSGLFAAILIYFVLGMIGLLGIIPIVGLVIYYFFGKFILNKLIEFTGIELTWLTTLIFWIHALFAIVMTCVGIIFILSLMGKSVKDIGAYRKVANHCKSKFDRKEDVKKCIKRMK